MIGTGSSQGKFTIQIGLINEFKSRFIQTGFLGTEPSSELFGADYTYPMGFDSSIEPAGKHAVLAVNEIMHRIDLLNKDIIITGSQANTVPLFLGGLRNFPIVQTEFLYGTQADLFILTVTPDTEWEYIHRTINYAESIFSGKIIALCVFPFVEKNLWSVTGHRRERPSAETIDSFCKLLWREFNIPAFSMSDEAMYSHLADICLGFLHGE